MLRFCKILRYQFWRLINQLWILVIICERVYSCSKQIITNPRVARLILYNGLMKIRPFFDPWTRSILIYRIIKLTCEFGLVSFVERGVLLLAFACTLKFQKIWRTVWPFVCKDKRLEKICFFIDLYHSKLIQSDLHRFVLLN